MAKLTYRLCVHELASGSTEAILTTNRMIEAPNWHPDGTTLFVNGDGRLFSVALKKPALVPVDTGFADKLNNDHGISPDGTLLAISDWSQTGTSCIYTLPISGGTPQRITLQTPSNWHSWSPDGKTLAYAARRHDSYQICTIPAEGGAEMQLTSGFSHSDGPDYTPDGKWIWFNAERPGEMNLWRMRPDGSKLEQMTNDAPMNWFPHPSPDGKHVLYLAYAAGVFGHPRNHDVELRLMPADGGASRCLRAIFGGQGSLNVPCWSPGSDRFAYVEVIPEGAIG
ncbi:MAG TPA: hypothetical protein VLA51_03060 [Paracoccaceae bacterium]|nr:hypothetical protein [Paracoccaceae bacterium]